MPTLSLKKNYTSYPVYHDSGVEWIGKIPEGWEVKKLKFFTSISLGKMLQNENTGSSYLRPYLRAQNILWEKVDIVDVREMWFSRDEIKQHRIHKNDLLVSEGGEVGRTAIWQDELIESYVQNSINRVTVSKDQNPKFLLYEFEAFGKQKVFESIVNKVSIAHLTREKLKEIQFIVPTRELQNILAEYLERKLRIIDQIIAKKQKLIELLQEKRAAIINQAIHYNFTNSSERLRFSVELNPSKQELKFLPGNFSVSFVPMETVSETGELNLEQEKTLDEVREGFTYFKNDDVVVAKITPCFENGKGARMRDLKGKGGLVPI